MKLALMNIDKFVQVNHIMEVTNPILMDRGYRPTSDGILSTDIFGSSTQSRRNTFAYIELNTHLLQPLAYKTLLRLDRRIDDILAGTKTFIIDKEGQLKEDENGDTGIEWLYKVWEKIKFKRNESSIRNNRIKFFEMHTKAELFQTKQLVIPPFYRDINLQATNKGKPSVHEINQPYCRLIRMANVLTQGDFAFNLNYTKFQMQKTIVELYDMFKSFVEKKRGILKQAILGKSVDYGARLVISNTKFTAERPSDMIVDFEHAGIPLSYAISLFTPFVIGWIQNFFKREFELTGNKYPVYITKTKEVRYLQLKDPMIQFNEEKIHAMIKTYSRSAHQRFDPILIETEDKEIPTIRMVFMGNTIGEGDYADLIVEEQKKETRPMTLTDLFYICMEDITKDKHVYITRYPMTDYMGIFPCGIALLSTNDTCHMVYHGKEYRFYPIIDMKADKNSISTFFSEVVNIQNTYLSALNGKHNCRCSLIAGNSQYETISSEAS